MSASPSRNRAVLPQRVAEPGARPRIVVAEARIPFGRDGAQLHAQSLVAQLRRRGYDAESVALPFRGRKDQLLDRLLGQVRSISVASFEEEVRCI